MTGCGSVGHPGHRCVLHGWAAVAGEGRWPSPSFSLWAMGASARRRQMTHRSPRGPPASRAMHDARCTIHRCPAHDRARSRRHNTRRGAARRHAGEELNVCVMQNAERSAGRRGAIGAIEIGRRTGTRRHGQRQGRPGTTTDRRESGGGREGCDMSDALRKPRTRGGPRLSLSVPGAGALSASGCMHRVASLALYLNMNRGDTSDMVHGSWHTESSAPG